MKLRLSFQSWIFGACIIVVLSVLLFMTVFLEQSLQAAAVAEQEKIMRLKLAMARKIADPVVRSDASIPELDALAGRLAERFGLRVTLLRPDGRMVGDSSLSSDLWSREDDLLLTPEVGRLLDSPPSRPPFDAVMYNGFSLTGVTTAGGEDVPLLIVRLHLPSIEPSATQELVYNAILWAGAFGMGISLVLAFFLAHQWYRPVRDLTRTALDISSGDLTQRLRRYPNHEIGDLGRAFDRMADHLQEEIEEVTRARDRLEAILRGMVEGVLVTDSHGRITHANRALRELVNLEAYPIGRTLSETIRNADLIEAVRRVIEGAPYADLEIRTLARNPRILRVEMAALPDQGDRAGVVAVFHDITELKRMEDMRRDFVANVSHEFRTPLAAIHGAVETLLSGALDNPKFARKFTGVIERHVKRLERLVIDLLDLARLESGQDKGPKKDVSVDLNQLAASCLAAVSDLAVSRQVTLKHEPAAQPLTVLGQARQLEQAVVNLLENAIKYTEPGGRVTLRVYRSHNDSVVEVSDTGIGIPPEYQNRIFERFYRVDTNRSREMGGTGLGLAIVKHVAQISGGRVELDSFPGRGSTFRLVFPQT
jgi:two-component system phosphate regulon sensor histidine kinase PhoR